MIFCFSEHVTSVVFLELHYVIVNEKFNN